MPNETQNPLSHYAVCVCVVRAWHCECEYVCAYDQGVLAIGIHEYHSLYY